MVLVLAVLASVATLLTVVLGFMASVKARPLQPDLHQQFQNTWLELQSLSGTLRNYFKNMAAHAEAGELIDERTGITPRALVAYQNGAAEAAAAHERIVKLEFGDTTAEVVRASSARGWMLVTAAVGVTAAILQLLLVLVGN